MPTKLSESYGWRSVVRFGSTPWLTWEILALEKSSHDNAILVFWTLGEFSPRDIIDTGKINTEQPGIIVIAAVGNTFHLSVTPDSQENGKKRSVVIITPNDVQGYISKTRGQVKELVA